MATQPETSPRRQAGAYTAGDDGGGRKKGLAWLVPLLLLALLAAAGLFLLARNAWDEGDKSGIDLTNDRSASGEAKDDPTTDERGGGNGDAGSATTDAGSATTDAGSPTTDAGSATTDGGGSSATTASGGSPTTASGGSPTTAAGSGTTTAGGTPTTAAGSGTTAAGGGSGTPRASPLVSEGKALLPLPADGLASSTGKSAQGTSVVVESVVSDEGFWVGDSPEQRVFVRLNTGGAESPVQIAKGRKVSFTGKVTLTPADVSTFGVTAGEGDDLLKKQGQYIAVGLNDIKQG